MSPLRVTQRYETLCFRIEVTCQEIYLIYEVVNPSEKVKQSNILKTLLISKSIVLQLIKSNQYTYTGMINLRVDS